MAKMDEVYGFTVDPDTIEGPYVDVTVDHLFGAVWTREALDVRDRRHADHRRAGRPGPGPTCSRSSSGSALDRGELTEEQVREVVLHLAHYIGWPLSTGVNAAAEKIIARAAQGRRGGRTDAPTDRGVLTMTDSRPTPPPRFDFTGKVAIVTGSAGGIGQAYAEALAAAGASVVVADIDADRAEAVAEGIRASGGSGPRCGRRRGRPGVGRGHGRRRPSTSSGASTTWSTTPPSSAGMKLDLLLTVDWEYLNRFLSVNMLGRAQLRPGLLAGHEGAGRRGDRQPVVDGRLPLRRVLRTGQGRGELDHPAAGPRARGRQHPHQRHRPRPHRHRGVADGGARRLHAADPGRPRPQAAWARPPTWSACACSCCPTRRRGSPATSSTSTAARWSAREPGAGDAPGDDHRIELEFLDHGPGRRLRPSRGPQRLRLGHVPGRGRRPVRVHSGDDDVHAVVLTGRGKAFTSGQDLREMAAIATGGAGAGAGLGLPGPARRAHGASTSRCWPRSTAWAWGSAARSLGHVDLVLMDESARLRAPFAEMGVPARGGQQLCCSRRGWAGSRRRAVLLASEWITADEAVASGLALRTCPDGTVLAETLALARTDRLVPARTPPARSSG